MTYYLYYFKMVKHMGVKGDKLTSIAEESAMIFMGKIKSLSEISHKKMFGGVGIFHQERMFAMVNSKGEIFLKSNDVLQIEFEKLNSIRHHKMPYYSLSKEVMNNDAMLIDIAKKSINASKAN